MIFEEKFAFFEHNSLNKGLKELREDPAKSIKFYPYTKFLPPPDKNNNGRVDDISELFGSDRQSGFAELGLYDSNRDGKIDAFDEVFRNLKVWQDRDGDGRTDAGELFGEKSLIFTEIDFQRVYVV